MGKGVSRYAPGLTIQLLLAAGGLSLDLLAQGRVDRPT